MNAGMPGTGLGGLFYVVLALSMPLLEVVRTVQGRSSRERWRLALTQASIALGVVAATVAVVLGAQRVVPGAAGAGAVALLAPLVALGVLAALAAVVGVWGAWARHRDGPVPAAASAGDA